MPAREVLGVAGHGRFWEQGRQTGQRKQTLNSRLHFLCDVKVARTEIKTIFRKYPPRGNQQLPLWETLDFRSCYYNGAGSRLFPSAAQALSVGRGKGKPAALRKPPVRSSRSPALPCSGRCPLGSPVGSCPPCCVRDWPPRDCVLEKSTAQKLERLTGGERSQRQEVSLADKH